ncbi:MAG: UDP-N-acetylglucosamine--N-acetylmuramyl-(pentapeptide) pyrophosphoryl-undecaprenol N-acetylglucosamine transferase [Sedimentisphaerales bacterium]|nr:UDP-N-acetylglucosamine--N-acetylmuramyl-(pentapeptide) pyrophosphoryl-undecaprenol N-acetylglucosamine transferase [Sedimentisphaerales bacterium]
MKHIYFAAGGTGGHIYPAIAVAKEILRADPSCKITFFCSQRPIDARILSGTGFNIVPLPARAFSKNPYKMLSFIKAVFFGKNIVAQNIISDSAQSVLFSTGGFVSACAVLAANDLKIPTAMLNIDSLPGKANKLLARYVKDIFVQFEDTGKYFGSNRTKVTVSGCPLPSAFFNAAKETAMESLGLNPKKKVLLITGASSGSANINNVINYLFDRLESLSSDWQIVHLAGIAHYDTVRTFYKRADINHVVLDYCDDMPSLLAAADLVIGRAGAMSIAEFAASGTPAICLPYPYHSDKHQRHNAQYLLEAGCGCIVEDLCDTEKTARLLWPVLCELAGSDGKLRQMRQNCDKIVNPDAAKQIATMLLSY